ncbi:unnamed protein product [Penicillium bialowiezense]
MKDNILLAVLLIVGLLTPVFGWLFYCWFRSHVADQHLEGQVFHMRSRDRTQANWRHGNGDTMNTTLGPHFTQRGWVRPKPYGETNVLPLSHLEERRPARTPNPQTSPRLQHQQPNPLSKRQQRKQRAKQNKQQQQQQQQGKNQNRQQQKNKNQGNNQNHHQNRNQSQDRSYQRSPREQTYDKQDSGWGAGTPDKTRNHDDQDGDGFLNLGALYENAEDEQQNKFGETGAGEGQGGGWNNEDDNTGGQNQTGWPDEGNSENRHNNDHSAPDNGQWGHSNHYGSNQSNHSNSQNRSPRRGSPARSQKWGHEDSHQQSSWHNNDNDQQGQESSWRDNQPNDSKDWNENRHESAERGSRGGQSPRSWNNNQDKAWGDEDRNDSTWPDEGGNQHGGQQPTQEGNRRHSGNGRSRRQGGRSKRQTSPRNNQGDSHSWNRDASPDLELQSNHKANDTFW